ncbi:c3HC zinc finger-like domain-containing protein [Sarocladium implicatum]|nr:c3HC zinc finger-like domain-containing protein [Sarocladium implicatum]
MSATKRKFNALLQGLSDTRTSQDDSPSAYDALLQKRRRLGFPSSTAPKFDPPSTTTTDLSSSISHRRRQRASHDISARKPAIKYCPSDREELLSRLGTFQDITRWTPKPDKISEIEWAKRGWFCHAKETVRCVLCSKELILKLSRTKHQPDEGRDDDDEVSSTDALVDKYSELIVDSHQEDCLWRKRGCDDTLLRLQLANSNTARASLRDRYYELHSRESHLPYFSNLRLPDGLDIDATVDLLPRDFLSPTEPAAANNTAKPQRVALALALCGWQGLPDARMGSISNSVSCRTCLRRLGLWMFKSKKVDEAGNTIIPAPMEYLDIVREHRFFCPWRSPRSQASATTNADSENPLPGWLVLLQTLENESRLRTAYGEGPVSKSTSELASVVGAGEIPADEDGIDEEGQKAKDKERWARLKKIKSLFDIKGAKSRSRSRPGTSHSTRSTTDKS